MAMFRSCFVGQFAVLTLLVATAEGQASSKPSDAVAQQARTVMPTVASASVPFYPRVIRGTKPGDRRDVSWETLGNPGTDGTFPDHSSTTS